MTLSGGTSQACAACKYQRRKCTSECPLAPYFPADKPKMFQNAHRLFGVRNILNVLKQVDPSMHIEAMNSIIFQSTMRNLYPVEGCLTMINQLSQQLKVMQDELHSVHTAIFLYRQQQQQQQLVNRNIVNHNNVSDPVSLFHRGSDQTQFRNDPPGTSQHFSSSTIPVTDTVTDYKYNSLLKQHQYGSTSNVNSLVPNQQNFVPLQMLDGQEVQEPVQEYNETIH